MGYLRLFLAVAVILTHAGCSGIMVPGNLAVRVFYIISGFYMALILNGKYGFSRTGIKKFFLNRVLRLYPTYYVALAGSIAWYFYCVWRTHGHGNMHSIMFVGSYLAAPGRILLWLPNFTLVGLDVPGWFNYSVSNGLSIFKGGIPPSDINSAYWLGWTAWLPQAWTISAEICFYVLAPFAVQGNGWRALVMGLLSFGLCLYLEEYCHIWSYFFWPSQFYLFAMGIIAFKASYAFRSKIDSLLINTLRLPLWTAAILWIVLMPMTGITVPNWLLLGSSMLLIPLLFQLSKDSVVDRFIGNLSYPVYCIHFLAWELARTAIGRFGWSWGLFPLLSVVGSLVAGCIVYFAIDHFIERLRVRVAAPNRLQED